MKNENKKTEDEISKEKQIAEEVKAKLIENQAAEAERLKKDQKAKAEALKAQFQAFLGNEFIVVRSANMNAALAYIQRGPWNKTNKIIQAILEDDKMPINQKK